MMLTTDTWVATSASTDSPCRVRTLGALAQDDSARTALVVDALRHRYRLVRSGRHLDDALLKELSGAGARDREVLLQLSGDVDPEILGRSAGIALRKSLECLALATGSSQVRICLTDLEELLDMYPGDVVEPPASMPVPGAARWAADVGAVGVGQRELWARARGLATGGGGGLPEGWWVPGRGR